MTPKDEITGRGRYLFPGSTPFPPGEIKWTDLQLKYDMIIPSPSAFYAVLFTYDYCSSKYIKNPGES
jgi:hypothetical protein